MCDTTSNIYDFSTRSEAGQRGVRDFSSFSNISMVREGGIEPPALLLTLEYLNKSYMSRLG